MSWFNHIIISIGALVASLFGGNHVYNSDVATTSIQDPAIVVNSSTSTLESKSVHSTLPIATAKPPTGYMVPDETTLPAGYILEHGGFTNHSAFYDFRGKNHYQALSFIDTNTSYLSQSLGNVMSFPGAKTLKSFVYKGNQGVVTGDFEENLYEGAPSSATEEQPFDEYYLLYDNNGRLVEIHTYDVNNITPDKLIQLLEDMKLSQ